MAFPRVYADFHNLDDANRLMLTCRGTWEDLKRQGIELRDGLMLTFYTDDADERGQPDEMRIEGTVQYVPEKKHWVAAVDWNQLRHASDEKAKA